MPVLLCLKRRSANLNIVTFSCKLTEIDPDYTTEECNMNNMNERIRSIGVVPVAEITPSVGGKGEKERK